MNKPIERSPAFYRQVLDRLARYLVTAARNQGTRDERRPQLRAWAAAVRWLLHWLDHPATPDQLATQRPVLADLIDAWTDAAERPQIVTIRERATRFDQDLRALRWACNELDLDVDRQPTGEPA